MVLTVVGIGWSQATPQGNRGTCRKEYENLTRCWVMVAVPFSCTATNPSLVLTVCSSFDNMDPRIGKVDRIIVTTLLLVEHAGYRWSRGRRFAPRRGTCRCLMGLCWSWQCVHGRRIVWSQARHSTYYMYPPYLARVWNVTKNKLIIEITNLIHVSVRTPNLQHVRPSRVRFDACWRDHFGRSGPVAVWKNLRWFKKVTLTNRVFRMRLELAGTSFLSFFVFLKKVSLNLRLGNFWKWGNIRKLVILGSILRWWNEKMEIWFNCLWRFEVLEIFPTNFPAKVDCTQRLEVFPTNFPAK